MSEYFDKARIQLLDAIDAYLEVIDEGHEGPGLNEIHRFNDVLKTRNAMIAAIPSDYFTNPYTLNWSGRAGNPQ